MENITEAKNRVTFSDILSRLPPTKDLWLGVSRKDAMQQTEWRKKSIRSKKS